jgi:hypothetical protein
MHHVWQTLTLASWPLANAESSIFPQRSAPDQGDTTTVMTMYCTPYNHFKTRSVDRTPEPGTIHLFGSASGRDRIEMAYGWYASNTAKPSPAYHRGGTWLHPSDCVQDS